MRYRLGLDLGVASLGWAVVQLGKGKDPQPVKLVAAGVRIFEAGVEGDVEQGKDSSRGAERRMARQPRRQHWRTQHRKRNLFVWLQKIGLLPKTVPYPPESMDGKRGALSEVRDQEMKKLDEDLGKQHLPQEFEHGDADALIAYQKLPYILRAKAVEGEKLELFELGRALYHLVQRRGYASNRKGKKDADEEGKVAGGIKATDEARGERTLAQYVRDSFKLRQGRFGFEDEAGLFGVKNQHDKSGQILKRYTARKMYMDEFEKIRAAQAPLQPRLTEDDWKRIKRILFFQRPLKSQSRLIGRCSLEPDRRRCTIAIPLFQEFRVLQAVNHLQAVIPGLPKRSLTDDERQVIINTLQSQGEMALSKVRTLLKLPKGTTFTQQGFGDEDDQKLIGHRTNAKLAPIFGEERWQAFSDEERERIALEVLHYRKPEALERRAVKKWGFDAEQAKKLAAVSLEEGYGSLSRVALEKLLPLMRTGTPYATARLAVYPASFQAGKVHEKLPPVNDWNRDIRNPAVIRAMTELRKVVNALIDKHGPPEQVFIELARDLKNSRDRRKKLWKDNEDNRKRREKATAEIIAELKHIARPSRADVEKWMLAVECDWTCAYTGQRIDAQSLLGSHPKFDVEHIYPRRYLDDSFGNKTLCDVDFNRHQKQDRLPIDCMNEADFAKAVQRVKAFKGPHAERKLERFEMPAVPEGFVTRHMNDTRYNSRLAAQYLGTLFGGRNDESQTQRVFTPTGGLTWMLRKGWELDSILSEDQEKDRDDHRHHAIDALIVALSSQDRIQKLASLAEQSSRPGSRFNAFLNGLEEPWPSFLGEAHEIILGIHVSHRPTRTLAGPLHAETNYSKPFPIGEGKKAKQEFRIRKSLDKLTEKEILGDQIIDDRVRVAVQQKYHELCAAAVTKSDKTPAKFWGDKNGKPENFPMLKKEDGTGTGSPVFKVRFRTDNKPRTIGKGVAQRQIASGKDSNYASMVYAVHDKDGKELYWAHEVVTRLDAHLMLNANRKQAGEKVLVPKTTKELQTAWKLKPGETVKFLFSLMKNDCLLLAGPDGGDVLYKILSFSGSEIQLCDHNLSRLEKADRSKWDRITNVDSFRQRKGRKVAVSPDGDLEVKAPAE